MIQTPSEGISQASTGPSPRSRVLSWQSASGLWLPVLLIPLLAYATDFGFNDYTKLILFYIGVNMILAMSLNLVNGFTGQFSLGHAGFMAVGAYLSAWLSTKFTLFGGDLSFLNFFLYPIIGGLGAAAAGFLVGLPSLNLRGDYLAIVTLGFSEIIRVVLLNLDAVGGARGFYGIPGPSALDLSLGSGQIRFTKFYLSFSMILLWVWITFAVLYRLIQSSHGRALLSVREDEIAAESLGVPTTKYKVFSFVTSSFFAGIAGGLFAHFNNYLNPSTFQFVKSIDVVIMVVLGGMGSLSGSLLGAIFVTLAPELLRPLQTLTGYDLRMIIYALTLILLMIVRPQGLLGSLEIYQLFRRRSSRDALQKVSPS